MDLLQIFKWRYATKKYNPTKKVDQESVDQIIEAAWLAPTSSGLQPFQVICITNPEMKEKIVPIAEGQRQVSDCSHLLVFAAWDNYTDERIDHIYRYITSERGQDPDQYKPYTDQLKAFYRSRPAEENFRDTSHQAYIGLGFSMVMAARLRVDTTPIGGFVNEQLDQLLNLRERGLRSVLLLPLGYRDEAGDWLVNLKKVRHPMSEFLIRIE